MSEINRHLELSGRAFMEVETSVFICRIHATEAGGAVGLWLHRSDYQNPDETQEFCGIRHFSLSFFYLRWRVFRYVLSPVTH